MRSRKSTGRVDIPKGEMAARVAMRWRRQSAKKAIASARMSAAPPAAMPMISPRGRVWPLFVPVLVGVAKVEDVEMAESDGAMPFVVLGPDVGVKDDCVSVLDDAGLPVGVLVVSVKLEGATDVVSIAEDDDVRVELERLIVEEEVEVIVLVIVGGNTEDAV